MWRQPNGNSPWKGSSHSQARDLAETGVRRRKTDSLIEVVVQCWCCCCCCYCYCSWCCCWSILYCCCIKHHPNVIWSGRLVFSALVIWQTTANSIVLCGRCWWCDGDDDDDDDVDAVAESRNSTLTKWCSFLFRLGIFLFFFLFFFPIFRVRHTQIFGFMCLLLFFFEYFLIVSSTVAHRLSLSLSVCVCVSLYEAVTVLPICPFLSLSLFGLFAT